MGKGIFNKLFNKKQEIYYLYEIDSFDVPTMEVKLKGTFSSKRKAETALSAENNKMALFIETGWIKNDILKGSSDKSFKESFLDSNNAISNVVEFIDNKQFAE